MGTEVKPEEEKEPVRFKDSTRPHLRRFFKCEDKPPGEAGPPPWKRPVHGLKVKER